MSQRMRACGQCRELFEVASMGRPPTYCSTKCRKKAWEDRKLREQIVAAEARAVAAERRRVARQAANRGNESWPPDGIRGNETPVQARGPAGPEPLPGLEGDYALAPPVPPVPPRPPRRPLSAPRPSLDQEASRAWRRAAMRPVDDAQPSHGDAGTDAERP